jgi:hypothetical protein
MMENDPELERRKGLTFKQAEGLEPPPSQLARHTISQELRARVWEVFEHHVEREKDSYGTLVVDDRWSGILRRKWVRFDHQLGEFSESYQYRMADLKSVIGTASYGDFFGLLQWLLRDPELPEGFARDLAEVFKICRAAYRLIDRDTIVPIADPLDAVVVDRALADTRAVGADGARTHLAMAAKALTVGRWADSVRESVNAVESTARLLAPGSKELGAALTVLESRQAIHTALKRGFGAIYGYTSQEPGLRHPLIDDPGAQVDETDAMFMLGACSSFVSYLIGKGRAAGLVK